MKKALNLHDKVLSQGFQMTQVTYGILIDGLCKIGETKVAIQLLLKIEYEAYHLYSEMVSKRISPTIVTYNVLIDALCKRGQLKEAKTVLAVMFEVGVKPDILTFNRLMGLMR